MSDPRGTVGTYRRYLYELYKGRMWRGFFGSRFMIAIGLLWDSITQMVTDALLAPLHQRTDGPAYDALRLLGNETSMPQYPFESWLQYRSRLRTDWETWKKAGDETTIVDQLELAGRPGAQVFRFSDTSSWSDFVILYLTGTHPVTTDSTVGSFIVGDGTSVGVAGITPEELTGYKQLIQHWKPAQWRCPWIVWEISGWTIGTGPMVGDPSLTVGGQQLRTQVQT